MKPCEKITKLPTNEQPLRLNHINLEIKKEYERLGFRVEIGESGMTVMTKVNLIKDQAKKYLLRED